MPRVPTCLMHAPQIAATTARLLAAASPLMRAVCYKETQRRNEGRGRKRSRKPRGTRREQSRPRAGYNTRTKSNDTSVCVAAVGRQELRADIEVILPLPHGPTLLDISMIHPHCPTYDVAASQTRGAAATLRDRSKYRVHAGLLHPRHTSVPASVEI
jgi:hypothetical protein